MSLSAHLSTLSRPSLLVRAARFQSEAGPEALWRQIFGLETPHREADRHDALLEREALADAQRKTGDAAYSIARHILVLAALMAEARRPPAFT